MENLPILVSLFLPVFFVFSCSISLDHTNLRNQCLDDQQSALMQLQHDLYYAPNFTFSSKIELWDLNTDCCYWKGVICDAVGHVIGLDLNSKNLSGSFYSIFNLNHLQSLNLAGNNFNSTLFEYEFGKLPNLTHLNLSSSCFHGQIPIEISYLTRLVSLDFSWNQLSGSIPSSLFTLPSLRHLFLEHNQLGGEIDEFPDVSSSLIEDLIIGYNSFSPMKIDMFFQLNKLESLHLSNISLLIGSHNNKSLASFPQLESLSLESCNLTEFPEFIKTQDKLSFLSLSNNQIHGLVPNWLWKSTLVVLDLSSNALSSLDQFSLNHSPTSSQHSLHTTICNLSQLVYFNTSFNKLSGSIPSCLGDIPTLRFLDLQQNNFSGRIPDFGGAPLLNILQLKENNLEGKLPRSLAKCTMLKVLNLGNNSVHDTFPLWLGKLPALIALILRANRFYGPIKHLKNNFQVLNLLDIASNNFSGPLSTKFFQATQQLRLLKIGGNRLEGKLPRSLANCRNLEVLDFGKNMIHDTFPLWLVKLPFLKVLRLRSNKFYGTIHFSGDGNAFPALHILDLASNNFSGELSVEFFRSLRAMMVVDGNRAKPDYVGYHDDDVNYYYYSVTIVNKGFEIFYPKILTILTCLDLSNNNFHGRISEEIQDLKSLHVLNLSYNSFFGPIPSAVGSLTKLESLDLSQNNLSGKIPLQLTSLTFLAVLNLSYNQLEGSIPHRNQFGTFLNDSYIGNPRLCGLTLTKKCNEVGSEVPPPKEDEDSWLDGLLDWKLVLIGYGCGLVIGFSIGYTVLNEFGNAWIARFTRNWNRKPRF